ncbi:hypothetical protein [Sutcliffiella horikoshii]|uniref:hypothetical protein n=1 Tax=Sutcliffiella horikoshii TaxID=79883 RepID=UPI0016536135|nr:hypothetical protein [Sutcliffiella horikoshii]
MCRNRKVGKDLSEKLFEWGEVFIRWMKTSERSFRVGRGLHKPDEDLREKFSGGERSS